VPRKQGRAQKLSLHAAKATQRLEDAKHLRPDSHHGQKQRKRRQRHSFLDYGPDHDLLPDKNTREHSSRYVLESSPAVGQFEMWRRLTTLPVHFRTVLARFQ